MALASVYCFVTGDSREAAISRTGMLLSSCNGEFYDGYQVRETDVQLLADLSSGYLAERRTRHRILLRKYRKRIKEAWKTGNCYSEAYAMRRASDLLYENMCVDMPWFNLEQADFFVPSSKVVKWWAVMVDFY
jgi:hypothetical protein